jgi:hypothetical protein
MRGDGPGVHPVEPAQSPYGPICRKRKKEAERHTRDAGQDELGRKATVGYLHPTFEANGRHQVDRERLTDCFGDLQIAAEQRRKQA